MSNDHHQDRDRDVREKILSLMRSLGQTPKKQITSQELEKLKSAAVRLDQMLKASADADLQTLRSAAVRLDQLLSDIGKGKDVSQGLKRGRDGKSKKE